MTARSYLFVPADRPDRFAKALAAGADAVVVDLEDAVPPGRKREARDALANWLAADLAPARVVVRVNAAGTAEHEDDLRACAHSAVAAVMVPKAEDPATLADASAAAGGRALIALVESARGIAALRPIAAVEAVERIAFGSIDFQLDLGIEGDGDELLLFRSKIVLASRLAGLAPPIDGVTTAIDDAATVTRDAARARRLGFGAKLCIHPRQVAAVHDAFMPSAAELDWARRVLAAAQGSAGAAVAVDGKMVDAPVIGRARALLARSGLAV